MNVNQAPAPLWWAAALGVSLLVNAGMIAVIQVSIAPDPIPAPKEIETRIDVSSVSVPSQQAREAEAEAEEADTAAAGGDRLGVSSIPTSRARPAEPQAASLSAMTPEGETRSATALQADQVAAADPSGAALEAARPSPEAAPAQAPRGETAPTQQASGARLASAEPRAENLSAEIPESETAAATAPQGQSVAAREAPGTQVAAATASGTALDAAEPSTQVAPAEAPRGETAPTLQASGARLASAEPGAENLSAEIPESETAAATAPQGQSVAAREAPGTQVAAATASGTALDAAEPSTQVAPAEAPRGETAAVTAPQGQSVTARQAPGTQVAAATASGTALDAAEPSTQVAPAEAPRGETAPTLQASGGRAPEVVPDASPAPTARTDAERVASSATSEVAGSLDPMNTSAAGVATQASLAWSGESSTELDEKSLAAIQSFMQPRDVARSDSFAGSVRDGIGAALGAFPCSRLQAAFQPETGGLEVRGHVAFASLKPRVVSMLEESVGGAIPIGGSIMVLPPPQCAVLDTIEDLGFRQSKDQVDDPLVVGEEAQARLLSLEEGEPVAFDLQAPEFDAYIYLDYFDKDGNVLHLMPSEYLPDNRYEADARFSVGERDESGDGLRLTVSPPFGQEIAIVLGTSKPLYEGLRPIKEDAAEYLKWLVQRIAELRREDPDAFRGEWVYLFVRTGPRGAFSQS